jgi:UDP-N-acetyl-D-glucosamine dehydrogenase
LQTGPLARQESTNFVRAVLLQHKGAVLSYSDPYIPQLHKMRAHDFSHMRTVDLTEQTLAHADLVLIATDHSSLDYQSIVDQARIVVATRGAVRGRDKIYRA